MPPFPSQNRSYAPVLLGKNIAKNDAHDDDDDDENMKNITPPPPPPTTTTKTTIIIKLPLSFD